MHRERGSWQNCAAFFQLGGCECAPRYRDGAWLRAVFVSRVFVGGCVFVSVPVVVCTSPEASCDLQPMRAWRSELSLSHSLFCARLHTPWVLDASAP